MRDRFFDARLASAAASSAAKAGMPVHRAEWAHDNLGSFRADLLACEQHGPDAAAVPFKFGNVGQLGRVQIVIVQFAPLNAGFFRAAKNLRLVAVNRAGMENIDLVAAREAGVDVIGAEGRNTLAVAEYSVAMLLAETRNIARAHAALAGGGEWLVDYPNSGHTPELTGRTVGLVGCGRIGTAVCELLKGFACVLLAYDPHARQLPPGVQNCGLDELMARCDVVMLHARLTAKNKGMIGRAQLALMKSTAVLVNTARAGLVDRDALADTLMEGRLAGAAVDVFDHEPPEADDPLLNCPRATVTPHLAGMSRDGFLRGPEILSAKIARWLEERHRGDEH